MELLLKVGNKYPVTAGKQHFMGWRDGQIVDIRPDGYYKSKASRRHFVVIKTPHDYWKLRGTRKWSAPNQKVLELKKFLSVVDMDGKYQWELPEKLRKEPEARPQYIRRTRDWFVDFKYLLDEKFIDQSTFESIYDQDRIHKPIFIDRDISAYLFREFAELRRVSDYSDRAGSVSSGTYAIGAGLYFTDVTEFEAAIAASLTGDLTGEHADEETYISSDITFDTQTSSYTLKLTAQNGAEHNGGAYGNGARINYGTYDSITFYESNDDDLANVEVSKLSLDASGTGNDGVVFYDCGGTLAKANRLLLKGFDGDGVRIYFNCKAATITNCIAYGFATSGSTGFYLSPSSTGTKRIYNNTAIGNYRGFYINPNIDYFYNNLVQNSNGSDYDINTNPTNHGYNISEDTTSPDSAYDNTDVHTNSVFKDYANDDYRLDSGGDSTNLAIVDDGTDLSSYFTDDIQGQTRSTWYIGASEIISGWTGKINGITNPAKIMGIDVANISKVIGV